MISENVSGRRMVKYDPTKSDPICKWRTASVDTVVELVEYLPKNRMSKDRFRHYMEETYGGNFFRTPYQLALQLGLYYEDDKEFIPRFNHDITKDEAEAYMAELSDFELDGEALKDVAGGGCYTECNSECPFQCPHDVYPA